MAEVGVPNPPGAEAVPKPIPVVGAPLTGTPNPPNVLVVVAAGAPKPANDGVLCVLVPKPAKAAVVAAGVVLKLKATAEVVAGAAPNPVIVAPNPVEVVEPGVPKPVVAVEPVRK